MEEESFVEMDSFTADMLKKIEKHKKLFSNISTDDNLEEMGDETTTEQIEKNNKIDGDDNELCDEEEDDDNDDDEDDELLNDDYCVNKVRESVSYLLNVRKSLLPSEIPEKTVEEEEEEVEEKKKVKDSVPNSRLNRRLNKISMFYEDEDNKKNNSKNTVLSEVNSNVEEERPARRLKLQDRLKEIASSYYPVWQDNDELSDIKKKKSNINKAEELKLNTKSESAIVDSSSSTTTTSDKSVSKQSENLFKSKSVAYEKTTKQTSTISNTKSKSIWNNKPLEDSKVSSSSTTTVEPPAVPLTKKTSVADLTKLFESKSKEESASIVMERPPELLTLREKRRLFEKAIKDESEASSKQYRRQPGPLKRPIQLVSSTNSKEEHTESNLQPDSKRPNIEKPELIEEPLENPPEIQQEEEVVDDIDEEHENSDRDISKDDDDNDGIGEQTAQDSVGEAFKTIDNYSIDEEEEDLEDEDTTGIQMEESKIIPTPAIDMDITFSTLDNPKIMIRSSTRTNVLERQEMPLNEIDEEQLEEDPEAPEKPPRLIRYSTLEQILDENDSQGELEQEPEQVPVDEQPLRTISFYRREQKMRKEGGGDLNQAFDADSVDQVVYLKQNQLAEKPESFGETDLVQFKIDLHEKIQTLKAEINEHNRISQQASTALNMCMSVPDLVNSSGRIEAERLLLISAEKRTACLAEINRLKSMIQNPEKFLPTLTGPPGSKGTVVINNLRIPLRNDFVVSRAKGKVSSSFYFLCLICNGPKIFISELLNTEKNLGSEYLEFNFGLNVTELDEDFHVELKLFSFELNPNQPESSHHKNKSQHNHRLFKRSFKESLKLSSSISSPAKVLSSKKSSNSKSSASSTQERFTDSPIPKSMTSSMLTNFKEIGRVTLTLANVRQTPKYYLLESFSITNPLDGYLTMNVSLKVSHHYTAQGFFDIQDSATSFWNLRWFVIRGNQLLYWRFPTDAQNDTKPALGSINLKNCINPTVGFLRADQRHLCMRPNTFVLVMIQPPVVSNATKLIKGGTITKPVPEIHFISSQSKEDSTLFCHHINRAIRNIRTWEIDAVRPYSNEEFDRLILNSH